VNNDVQLLMFADDTNMLMYNKNINSLERANLVLHDVWFKLNKLSLNVKKCNFMIFANKKLSCDITLKIDNQCIDRVTHTQFLGVNAYGNLFYSKCVSPRLPKDPLVTI